MDEQRRAYQKAYYEKNKGALLAKQRERNKLNYQANKQSYLERSNRWAKANPERMRKLQERYREENREALIQRSRDWYAQNIQRAASSTRKRLLLGYDLTQEAFNWMLEQQNWECAICGRLLTKPVVDHDHQTGEVRGLLCRKCNAAIGQLDDNPELLLRAAEYLTKSWFGATLTTSKRQLRKHLLERVSRTHPSPAPSPLTNVSD